MNNVKINYGLIAVQHVKDIDFKILHFCEYEERPTNSDIKSFKG